MSTSTARPALKLVHLETFVAVLDEGSLAAAARCLHVSRATITERLDALEADLGCRLLVRSASRPVEQTQAGRLLEPYARSSLRCLNDGIEAVRDLTTLRPATLRIGLMASGAAELNAPLFRGLARALPRSRVVLAELPLWDLEQSVLDGRVDAAILRSPVTDRRLRGVQLFLAPRVVTAAADGPFGTRTRLSVSDLADATFTGVNRANSPAYRRFFLLRDERNGEPPVRVMEARTLSQAGLHILAHGAIAVPSSEALRAFPMPNVVTVPLDGASPSGPIAVCRRDDRRPEIKVFLDVAASVAATCRDLVPDALAPET